MRIPSLSAHGYTWKSIVSAALMFAFTALLIGQWNAASAENLEIVVTSAGDSAAPDDAECPSEDACTLRLAIELVNADASEDRFVIRFDPAVFPPEAPTTIAVGEAPLPEITRPNVDIDARDAGVILDGNALPADEIADGLVLAGADASVRGMRIRDFNGTCISVIGNGAIIGGSANDGAANWVDLCQAGIGVSAEGVVIEGNRIDIDPGTQVMQLPVGIDIREGDARVGHATDASRANYIGNTLAGVRVGVAGSSAPATASIVGNSIGEAPDGTGEPVDIGVEIVPPAHGVSVRGNVIANTGTGIVIVNDATAEPSRGNTLWGNRYVDLVSMAIDFGPTGARIPNDANDSDHGPNGLLNHPVFERAVQAEVRGHVPGPCAGCTVDLYLAEHRDSAGTTVPTTPLSGTSTTTTASGGFSFTTPPIAPGDWLMALVTDTEGNTSEFSLPTRVGSGIVQCGNETLHPGWNTRGYFGGTTALGASFPPGAGASSPVRSIHQRVNESPDTFRSWFANGGLANDLTSLRAGEPYWFWVSSTTQLTGSFTLANPLPVSLQAGWNEFVYIGARVPVDVAFDGLEDNVVALFRYANDGTTEGWSWYAPGIPDWARGFDTMEPCSVYQVLVTDDVTFTPPQP